MWNYRVVRKKQTWVDPTSKQESLHYSYAIHEAYYDRQGYVGAITREPVEPYGETIEELRHAWVMMAEAFGQPILDYDMIPEPGYNREEDPLGVCIEENQMKALISSGEDEAAQEQEGEQEEEPFDLETYKIRQEQERVEKEHIHREDFVGTPTMKGLIDKIYSEYKAWNEQENHEK